VRGGGLLILALVLIGVPGFFAVRAVARRRGSPGKPKAGRGGIVSGWFAHRRALREKQADHEHGMRRDRFRSALRMREQAERERRADARRQAAAAAAAGAGGAAPGAPGGAPPGAGAGPGAPAPGAAGSPPPPSRPWQAVVTRVRGHGSHPGPGAGAAPAVSAPPRGSPPPPAAGGPGAPPPGPVPATRPPPPAVVPVQPGPRTIEGVVVTYPDTSAAIAVPGVEPIIEGAAALRRHAMNGNAQAKRRAILGIAAGIDVLAATVRALSSDMAEPGQHYGPEITEPMTGAASHLNAASTTLTEIDGRLLAIIRAAEELAARGVQAPHHEQMTAR
jgi:hypothetical protein